MGMLGSISKPLASVVSQVAEGNGGGLGSALKNVLGQTGGLGGTINAAMAGLVKPGPSSEQVAYIAALQAAIAKASNTPMFNLETQINDLWLKLDALKQNKPQLAALTSMLQSQQQLVTQLTTLVRQFNTTANQAMQILK